MEQLQIDDLVELEITDRRGSRVFQVARIGQSEFDRISKLEKSITTSDGMDEQLSIVYKLLMILAPDSKKADYTGYAIGGLYQIYQKMLALAISVNVDEGVKKNPVPTKRKSSRSRKRASA